ncbi:SDR family oxidoreductase [Acidilobus sp.]|uniref:SDR family oxidoreductase n=1 Tax=Acidilobus sp. TaxID=1872109 RepID=UPI003CFDB699
MGCNAIVTGASRGVGLEAARALASRGCDELLVARDRAGLEEAAREISSKYGVKAIPRPADMTSRESEAVVDDARSLLGDIDVAFVSYGNPPCEPCEPADASWDDWQYAASMYLVFPARLMGRLARVNGRKATVILVSSFSSRSPMWPTGVSDVVRAGLPAMAKLFSRAYPGSLRVIVLELGSFRTPGADRLIGELARREGVSAEDYWSRVASMSPLRRLGRPEELRELIAWLAFSPEYLTGTTVLFDGATLQSL